MLLNLRDYVVISRAKHVFQLNINIGVRFILTRLSNKPLALSADALPVNLIVRIGILISSLQELI